MSAPTLTPPVTEPEVPEGQAIRRELLENDQVLVVETTYAIGGGVPKHTHRFPHVAYIAEGGRLEVTRTDGTVEARDVRPGEILWRAPQSHSTRNVGRTRVRLVEVELKQGLLRPELWKTAPPVVTSHEHGWVTDPFDPRRKAALLVGDPTKPGPYTVRYLAPAGYAIGLHLHPDEDEQLTILSGVVYWSSGKAGSRAPEYRLTAGGFVGTPAGTPHRLWATEPSVLQLNGIGPRTYVYVDETDDPRARKA